MKNAKIGLLTIIAAVIALAVIASFYFTVASDAKFQFQQDYNTIWSSQLDTKITWGQAGENDKFRWTNGVYTLKLDDGNEVINVADKLETKTNLYGKEVALLFYCKSCRIDGIGGGSIPEFKISNIILRPDTFDNSKVHVITEGIDTGIINVQNPFNLAFRGSGFGVDYINIYFLGDKAQYSCDLASDEVWIQESFAQPFSIKDINFIPTKFCKETRPFVLRDIQQGETPIFPNPIPAFNRGEILQVPDGKIVTINYATPNVAGVTQPCGVDEANIKVAGRWVCSQVIKTTTITREVPTREIITVAGANQFTATKNFNIGNSAFSQSQSFNCQIPSDVDIVRFPSPNSDCYVSSVGYEGKSYDLKDKQLIVFNDYVSMQYFAGGQATREKQDLSGLYIFNVQNPFVIELQGGLTFRQQPASSINLQITNNLPANSIILRIKQKATRINLNLPDKELNINLIKGINDVSFSIDAANLGINEITVQAFYPIDADTRILVPSDIIKINTEVLLEGSNTIIKFIEIEKIVEKEKIVTIEKPNFIAELWNKFIAFIKNIFT